jgi:hypothetical protein
MSGVEVPVPKAMSVLLVAIFFLILYLIWLLPAPWRVKTDHTNRRRYPRSGLPIPAQSLLHF